MGTPVPGTPVPWSYGDSKLWPSDANQIFACFYVAGRGLTGRLPAEIVADCRWASPGVWLRWLFVWLFWAVLLAQRAGLAAPGFDTHDIATGGGDRFSVRAAAKKQQVKVPILVLWLLPRCLSTPSSNRLQKHCWNTRFRRGVVLGACLGAVSCCRIEPFIESRRRRWPGVCQRQLKSDQLTANEN